MLYKDKTVKDLDSKYGIKVDMHRVYPQWIRDSCINIQRAFAQNNIHLTLFECKDLYEAYSEELYCSTWNFEIEELTDEEIFEKLFPFTERILSDRGRRLLEIGREIHICKYKQLNINTKVGQDNEKKTKVY